MTVDQLWALVVTLIAVAVVATLKAVEVVEQKKLINKQLTDLRAEFEALNQQVKNPPLQRVPAAAHKPPPSFEKLAPLTEQILLNVASTGGLALADLTQHLNEQEPRVLHLLETVEALGYVSHDYHYHTEPPGHLWCCEAPGRAYLAHHGLI